MIAKDLPLRCRCGRVRGVASEVAPCDGFPTTNARPRDITVGPDGELWFTETGSNGQRIGRVTTDGAITEYPIPTFLGTPYGITAGPDRALWFTEFNSSNGNKIGRLDALPFILPGTPGDPNCVGKTMSFLAQQDGSIDAAAAAFKFASVADLASAVQSFCRN